MTLREYVIIILSHAILVIAPSVNPRLLSGVKLTFSGLIIGSQVNTAGDNQNPL